MTYSERFGDIAIVELNTTGFDKLSEVNKKLAYYLSEAGLWGKKIALEQSSRYTIPVLNALINLYESLPEEHKIKEKVGSSLFTLFAHNGIYHTMSGERVSFVVLTDEELDSIKDYSPESCETLKEFFQEESIPEYRTVQKSGVDVVKESGCNFYQGLTTEEVQAYRKEKYPKVEGSEVPPFGYNERLVKTEKGNIVRQVMSTKGLYGKYIKKIVQNLRKALDFTETEAAYNSINTLITAYETGSAIDFDKHCVAWVQDQESEIYFINGFIESYKDPLGIGCNFESIVAFKDPGQTAKVKKIIEAIQYFEDNLPVEERFKKEKATGLSASSINVVSMAGDCAPSLPLGVNLPNSAWVREKFGSKSVTLSNVDSSRTAHDSLLKQALYLDKYQEVIDTYGAETGVLHIDLHEIAGHGSCKSLAGVSNEDLSTYYSVIEECRADLVALFYVADDKLKEIGVYGKEVDVEKAALAKYVTYLTNGAVGQLRRVRYGQDLTQAHFRNRQLISTWVLEHADKDKICLIEKEGSCYIEVNDVQYARKMFGELLVEIQRIKSTGDFKEAQYLVEKYGTKVNKEIHLEILKRIEKLDMANVVGFITPELKLSEEGNSVIIEKPKSYLEQKIRFYKKYCS